MASVLTIGERLIPARRRALTEALRRAPVIALGAVCLYALAMIVSRVLFTSITYDDGYYAYISRNLAGGAHRDFRVESARRLGALASHVR